MSLGPRPPKWARRLLERALPKDVRDAVLGDLEEVFLRKRVEEGPVRAGLWYWRQAVAFSVKFLWERTTEVMKHTLPLSSLDFVLGFRMFRRYPGLTLVGGLAMAFAIWVGAGTFEFIAQVAHPALPFPDGERIVGIRQFDAARSRSESRIAFDFLTWKDEVKTVEDLGAFRTVQRNIVSDGGAGPPVTTAEISAAGFRVTGVRPYLGRGLQDRDELPGAEPAVVLGWDAWQGRLGADPKVVGRTVRVGAERRTVVGVMPRGFAFPVYHDAWIPLRTNTLASQPGNGPALQVFGRLAPGASMEEARAELAALGDRMALELPQTHEHLRPRVAYYPTSILDIEGTMSIVMGGMRKGFSQAILYSSNLPVVLFLVLIFGNVALLLFARAVAREEELVIRSALGAGRSRIVAQLFTEALLLTSVAAVVGLACVGFGLRWAYGMIEGEFARLPFWFRPELSPATLIYALGLTVLAAVVAGIVPALKVTRQIGTQLRRASTGGGGFRFGGVWSAVIVCQIAVTVAFPVVTIAVKAEADWVAVPRIGFPAADYLGARLEMDRTGGAGLESDSAAVDLSTRYRTALEEMETRLLASPRVAGVSFTERLPRAYHPWRQIQVEGPSAPPRDERGHRLGSATVTVDYFSTLGIEPLAGRGFAASDIGADPGVVIVNESFVQRILGGRNPIGRRIRYLGTEAYRDPDQEPSPWLEIVGVVEDLGTISGYGPQGMYHPADVGELYPVHIVIHARSDAQSLAPTLLGTALDVDPTLRLHDLMTLDHVTDSEQRFYRFWFLLLLTVTALALLLSLGGIYAVMAFTVTQRTREIGIRVALGSSPSRVVWAILRRPMGQVGLGVVVGAGILVCLAIVAAEGSQPVPLAALSVYTAFMTGVCTLGCMVPMRRALAVEPTEALRAE